MRRSSNAPIETVHSLPESKRKEIFDALLAAQKRYVERPAEAYQYIANRFHISEGVLHQIDLEGQEQGWLPLEEEE